MELFDLFEWAISLMECWLILSTVTAVAGKRYQGVRHYFALALSAICLTVLISIMNHISTFSFFTPIVAMAFIILILSHILSAGSLLICCTACIMAYFVVVTIDYILCPLFGLLYGWSEEAFSILITPGTPRAILLITAKLANLLTYLFSYRFLSRISLLTKKYQFTLLCVCLAAYVSVQYLFNAFMYSNVETLYSIILISCIYVFCFLGILIVVFILVMRSEQEKQTHILLETTNQLLAENYQQLYLYQQNHAKQIHDFNHHLTALKGLASMSKYGEIASYIDSLLNLTYQEASLCHSGIDIVDAIINYKAAEAEQLGINFSFTTSGLVPIDIDPVDLCGVLANQIDNALDACKQIPPSEPREVKVSMKQVENFLFFRVENTVEHNPFEHNRTLASTKTDPSAQHGLGLKNIRDIADKYSGFLRNEYKDGFFISVVSLCY